MNTSEIMKLDLSEHLTEEVINKWIDGQASIGSVRTAEYARMIAKPQTKIYHSKIGLHRVIFGKN